MSDVTATDHASPPTCAPLSDRLEPGHLLAGRYRVRRFVAAGGMGEVYETDDTLLGDAVALKLLRADFVRKPGAQQRFADEIRLARKVTHPNVCRVFDVGVEGERVFYTMELHDGTTLCTHRPPLALDFVRTLTLQLLDGIAAAHDADVVHADLKPSNVLLTRNRAVITDFGLAVPMCASLECPCAMPHLLGTPAYMAPEQVTGGTITERTDLFSLGVILFELVTGVLPWREPTALATANARLSVPAPSPLGLRPDLPPHWAALILSLLSVDPAQRPPSARAVCTFLSLPSRAEPAIDHLAFDRSG